MKNRPNLLKLVLLLFLLLVPQIASASIGPPIFYFDIHCNVNVSFIEDNLCELEDCSPKVKKYDSNYYVDKTEIKIRDPGLDVVSFDSHTPFYYSNVSDEFLKEACEQDITPVLNYIRGSNSIGDFNDFYPAEIYLTGEYSLDEPRLEVNVKQIDDGWYLISRSFLPPSKKPMTYVLGLTSSLFSAHNLLLYYTIILLVDLPIASVLLIGFVSISIYMGKRKKVNPAYILPILLGFLGGLIGWFVIADKEFGKKLLKVGLAVSMILFMLYIAFIVPTL